MQGPQAFASTTAPTASKSAKRPSRVIVARTCSDPGVIKSLHFAFRPWFAASLAIDAALVISSYEEFVQLPINAALISSGQSFSFASFPSSCTSRAKSGVCGPFMCGRSWSKSISIS